MKREKKVDERMNAKYILNFVHIYNDININ